MTPVLVVVAAAIVAVALAWALSRRRRHADGVDSFRRQIDALSPEARRSTVEQLNVESVDQPDDRDVADDDGT